MKVRKTDPSIVQSVERALQLLEFIAEADEDQSLSSLARRSRLSSSTTHRLLTTMAGRRFVAFDSQQSAWKVGPKAFSVGMAFAHRTNLVVPALGTMKALRDETNETVNLGTRVEEQIVTLGQVESRQVVRAVAVIGGFTPVVNCALGKAILATLDDESVASLLRGHGMTAYTRRSIRKMSALLEDLANIRIRGYAIDDGEFLEDVRCVAVPIFDMNGEAMASLSISGLKSRVSSERLMVLGKAAAKAGRALSEALGGSVPEEWLKAWRTQKGNSRRSG